MVGKTLGHYRILEKIGEGGMGVVYRARDQRLGRDVALKILPERFAADADRIARLDPETKSASALNHPNIVTVYEIGRQEAVTYIAMEWIAGKTLREILAQGPLAPHEVFEYAEQIAQGLAKAHEAGIVHRDLKPANLMVTADGLTKILDFGLAKLGSTGGSEDDQPTRDDRPTRPGAVMGTPDYMSPEQARGDPVDFHSDQFSLATILYEMAAGKQAFHRSSDAQTMAAIIEHVPDLATRLLPEYPAAFVQILERCWMKNPAHRYPSTRRLAKDLEQLNFGYKLNQLRPPAAGPAAPEPKAEPRAPSLARSYPWWMPFAMAASALLLATVVMWTLKSGVWDWPSSSRGGGPQKIQSLAVLPLANLSGDPNQEYFTDGMTEALIADLAQIRGLNKVISRTSVMQYKGVRKPMREIAHELGVDAVVEGSVIRSGDRVRITAQLIEGSSDKHLWARTFDRDLRDMLALQSEVARAIAGEIQITLTPQEQQRLNTGRAVNPEAHDAYLLGRFLIAKRNRADLDKGIEYFRKSIALDPTYAAAYAGLADGYSERDIWGGLGVGASANLVREAVLQALELDPNLAEAHIGLAGVRFQYDFDWDGAEREFQRALELNSNLAEAQESYAFFLQAMGKNAEAISHIHRAVELDPLSPAYVSDEGRILYRARRFDEAIARDQRALELDPQYGPAVGRLAETYEVLGKLDSAMAVLDQHKNVSGGGGHTLRSLASIFARIGNRDKALAIARQIERTNKDRPDAYGLAVIYTVLGDHTRAIQWLEKGVQNRSLLVFVLWDPKFDPLHNDRRFQALLQRLNLPNAARPR